MPNTCGNVSCETQQEERQSFIQTQLQHKMGQAETKIFENAPAWHESDVLATTDFEEEV